MYKFRYAALIAAALLFTPWAIAQRGNPSQPSRGGAPETVLGDPASREPGQAAPGRPAPQPPSPGQEAPPPGQTQPAPEQAPELNVVGERRLQGRVAEVQDARIEGTSLIYKVALVETDQGMVVADLGPAADLADVSLDAGTSVDMHGTLVEVDGRPFFVAKQLEVGDRRLDIRRELPQGMEAPGEQPPREQPPREQPPREQRPPEGRTPQPAR